MRRSSWAVSLGALCAAVACSGTRTQTPEPEDAASGGTAGSAGGGARDDATVAVDADALGFALEGEDINPALYRRVRAVPCDPDAAVSAECTTDAECGEGYACLCAQSGGFGFAHRCVIAECRSDADCGGGACLLSLGSQPGECCDYGPLGLYCSRAASTCQGGEDCPGNGVACMYSSAIDAFECGLLACVCE